MLNITLISCTSDQVWVLSASVVCRSHAPFWIQDIWNTQFPVLSCMPWHIELRFSIWHYFYECHIKFVQFVGAMFLYELKISKIHRFPTFFLHALTYSVYKFAFPNVRSNSSVVSFPQISPTCFDIKQLKVKLNKRRCCNFISISKYLYWKYTVCHLFLLFGTCT